MHGALILEEHFILHVSWKLRHSSFHRLLPVLLPGCHKPGSCCVKPSHFERFPGSFRVEKWENQWKSVVFGGKKLSLVEPSSGTRKYVKNQCIFGKCRVLRIKIKSLVLARFPWSFTLDLPGCVRWWGCCMKDVELLSGTGHPGKAVELWWWSAQLPGGGNEL